MTIMENLIKKRYQMLRQLLKRKQIWHLYLYNTKTKNTNFDFLQLYRFPTYYWTPAFILNLSFQFSETKEGYQFWYDIHNQLMNEKL